MSFSAEIDLPNARSAEASRRLVIGFLNWAHALDHFVILDLSDGGHRTGRHLRPFLCEPDCALDCFLCRLRLVLAAGRMARRPLEPAQSDGGVLYRLWPIAGRGGLRAVVDGSGDCAVLARRVRGHLSSGRHRDDRRARQGARPCARVQRRLRQSGRFARGRHHRRADRRIVLARRVSGARSHLHRDRDRSIFGSARRNSAMPPRARALPTSLCHRSLPLSLSLYSLSSRSAPAWSSTRSRLHCRRLSTSGSATVFR